MAKHWSGFLPQNTAAKEEWAVLEACEAKARLTSNIGGYENLDADWARSVRQIEALVDLFEKQD